MKTIKRTAIYTLLLMILSSQFVHAQTKVYQYDGKIPFVQMMLNMMTAMGVLDRLPNNRAYDNNGLSRNSLSPLSRYADPLSNSSSLWGNPSWGVLPTESYTPYGTQWSENDLNGWVNESWENSEWNPDAEAKSIPKNQPQAQAPIVQNFSYNMPANSAQTNNQSTQTPYAQPNQYQQRADIQNKRPSKFNTNQAPPSKYKSNQKPCITDFCGLVKPSLNGLWVAKNGEMLGVKNHRYLWSDSKSRYLTGQIKMQHEYLFANIDGYDQLMKFKYKLAGNNLITMQPDGELREFVRLSARQYNDLNYGRGQNQGNYYYQ